MNELDRLIQQKKEIQERIRQIKTNGIIVVDGAKLDVEHYATGKPDEWMISVMMNNLDTGRKNRWFSVVRGTNKTEVMLQIDPLIESLENLKKELQKELAHGRN